MISSCCRSGSSDGSCGGGGCGSNGSFSNRFDSNKDIYTRYKQMVHSLQWRHNGRDSVSNHQPHDCFPNRLFRRRSKKTSKLRVTDLCAGNSPGTGEFPAQMASYAENVSIWWRHHVLEVARASIQ